MLKNNLNVLNLAAAVAVFSVTVSAQQSPKTVAVKPAVAHPPAATTMLPAEQTALVKTYCATCHTDRGKDRIPGRQRVVGRDQRIAHGNRSGYPARAGQRRRALSRGARMLAG